MNDWSKTGSSSRQFRRVEANQPHVTNPMQDERVSVDYALDAPGGR